MTPTPLSEAELRALENGANKLEFVAEYECQDENTSVEYRRDAATLRALANRLRTQAGGEREAIEPWMVDAFRASYQCPASTRVVRGERLQELISDCRIRQRKQLVSSTWYRDVADCLECLRATLLPPNDKEEM